MSGVAQRLFPGIDVIDVHGHLGNWGYPGNPGGPDQLRRLLDRSGFAKLVISSGQGLSYDPPEGNAAVARFAESDERVFGSFVINPNYPEESRAEIERYSDHPRFVSAKIYPPVTGVAPNAPACVAMAELLAEKRIPATFHTWTYDGEPLEKLAKRVPELTTVWFHAFAADYLRAAELAADLPNVYLEYVTSTQERTKVADLVAALGSHRLLFGTDQDLFDPVRPLGQLLEAEIDDEDKRRILCFNALEVFDFEKS